MTHAFQWYAPSLSRSLAMRVATHRKNQRNPRNIVLSLLEALPVPRNKVLGKPLPLPQTAPRQHNTWREMPETNKDQPAPHSVASLRGLWVDPWKPHNDLHTCSVARFCHLRYQIRETPARIPDHPEQGTVALVLPQLKMYSQNDKFKNKISRANFHSELFGRLCRTKTHFVNIGTDSLNAFNERFYRTLSSDAFVGREKSRFAPAPILLRKFAPAIMDFCSGEKMCSGNLLRAIKKFAPECKRRQTMRFPDRPQNTNSRPLTTTCTESM